MNTPITVNKNNDIYTLNDKFKDYIITIEYIDIIKYIYNNLTETNSEEIKETIESKFFKRMPTEEDKSKRMPTEEDAIQKKQRMEGGTVESKWTMFATKERKVLPGTKRANIVYVRQNMNGKKGTTKYVKCAKSKTGYKTLTSAVIESKKKQKF